VLEAKGLEFNDVLLANFFDSGPGLEFWRLFKYLKVHEYTVPREEFEKQFEASL
jgi:hypothetical protein